MSEREPNPDNPPLGKFPKVIHISKEEMHLAWLHRQKTGEPMQSWVRRLIRENAILKTDRNSQDVVSNPQ